MRRVYVEGKPTKKLECEHCGNVMVEQEPVRVSDVVCGKCRMTIDRE